MYKTQGFCNQNVARSFRHIRAFGSSPTGGNQKAVSPFSSDAPQCAFHTPVLKQLAPSARRNASRLSRCAPKAQPACVPLRHAPFSGHGFSAISTPAFQRKALLHRAQHATGGFTEIVPRHCVALPGDPRPVIRLAGLIPFGREAGISPGIAHAREPPGIFSRRCESQSRHRASSRHAHQAPGRFVAPGDDFQRLIQSGDLRPGRSQGLRQPAGACLQDRIAARDLIRALHKRL